VVFVKSVLLKPSAPPEVVALRTGRPEESFGVELPGLKRFDDSDDPGRGLAAADLAV